MAALTPEEQAFFESGGDTAKLAIPEIDNAGLSHIDPPAVAPPVAAPIAPATEVVAPQADDLLRNSLAQSQRQANELQAQLDALKTSAQPKPIAAPDPATDPLGNMLHQLDQVNRNVADLQAKLLEQQNQQAQTAAFNKFQQQVTGLRDEFLKTAPDFQDAYAYLRAARTADLRQYGVAEADIEKQLFNEEFSLSQASVQNAKNPAAELYEMAKRHGYQAVKNTPTANTTSNNEAKIAALKAGVAAAPPSLPRTPVLEDISVDSLREASDSDLNKLVMDPASWAKIAGKDHLPI